jgi:arabinofuranosyltransferase
MKLVKRLARSFSGNDISSLSRNESAASAPSKEPMMNVLMISAFVCFSVLAYVYFPESIDDAYITLRYARNLFEGHGLVFNVGERVEGFSNFTWLSVLAAAGWSGLSMPMAMKVLSFLSGLVTLFLTARVGQRFFGQGLAGALPALLLASSSFFALWAVDGLETVFYTMLLTILLALLCTGPHSAITIGLVAGVAAISRPEAPLFAGIAVVAALVLRGWREALKVGVIVVLFAGSYELFRLVYFHAPVSNAAYLKLNPGWSAVKQGFHYLVSFDVDSALWPLPIAIVGLLAIRRQPILAIPAAFIAVQLFFIGLSGGDFMYGYRFLVPILPPLMLLVVAGLAPVLTRLGSATGRALAGAACLTLLIAQYVSLPVKTIRWDNLTHRASTMFTVGEYLRFHATPPHTMLMSESGIEPFLYAESKNVDYLGLTTAYHDVIDEHGIFRVDKLLQTRPHYVLLSFWIGQDKIEFSRLPQEAAILNNEMFKSNYRPIRDFEIERDASFLNAIYYRYWPDALRIRFRLYERTQP